jgi:hypothetical protein
LRGFFHRTFAFLVGFKEAALTTRARASPAHGSLPVHAGGLIFLYLSAVLKSARWIELTPLEADFKPAPAGFSFAFAFTGRGKLLKAPFKPMILGAADATGETNLAAHRCSNLL